MWQRMELQPLEGVDVKCETNFSGVQFYGTAKRSNICQIIWITTLELTQVPHRGSDQVLFPDGASPTKYCIKPLTFSRVQIEMEGNLSFGDGFMENSSPGSSWRKSF